MNCGSISKLIPLFLIAVCLRAQTTMIEKPDVRVEIHVSRPKNSGASPAVTLSILDKHTERRSTTVLRNYTASVEDAFVPVPGRLVAVGGLTFDGKALSVIDMTTGRLIDTIYTWEIAISHNKEYVAYEFRYPPYGLPAFRNATLLFYNFRLAPELIPRVTGSNDQVGFILYPEENRLQNKYELAWPCDRCELAFTSPIAWSSHDDRIAVLAHLKDETHLVVVDIAKGWSDPRVTRWRVDHRLFYKPEFQNGPPEEYRNVTLVPVSKLRFVDDDQGVEITSIPGAGPFAERRVRVSLADGSATVVSQPSPPAEPHLKVPPEMHYIRVGGAVQEKKLLSKVEPAYPQGTPNSPGNKVVFEALIDRDGRVAQLLAIQGQPEMIKAAEQAVRQWTYMRTLLNGEPVAVLTTITLRAN